MQVYKAVQLQIDEKEKTKAQLYSLLIKVSDIKDASKKMSETIANTSWLSKLDFIDRRSIEKTVNMTVQNLLEKFGKVDNKITAEFGQYFVSLTAQKGLEKQYNHNAFPLPELWKEKVTGNPGFDFHTIKKEEHIVFGEAKYQTDINSYYTAASQALEFSLSEKESYDFMFLRKFPDIVDEKLILKNINGFKSYALAFSFNWNNKDIINDNLIKNENVIQLARVTDVLFFVGIAYEPN